MTWEEFKEAVEAQGVTDKDIILYIDWKDWGVVVQRTEKGYVIII